MAQQFTESGEVRLAVTDVQSHGDTVAVHLSVSDTGIGISPEWRGQIFEAFIQADGSNTRRHGGTGLGLAISSRLVSLMGGRIWVESEVGRGSAFHITVTLGMAAHPKDKVQPAATEALRDLAVLVVDDNVDTALSFSMLLRASGHDVQTAHDGLKAVQAAIDYCPDIVLLDIGLPGLNGYEVAKKIRNHRDLKHVILVALTGYGQDSDRQASGEAGFTHHLVKPTRFDELQKILATVAEQVA